MKRRRKKSVRMRAQTTHGYGAKKKHRGAGNRGGRGMAGSGKRADQKKPSILKEYGPSYYGKHGFYKHNATKVKAVNLYFIENQVDKIGKKEGDFYLIDLTELGYDKLLGTGKLTRKVKVKCKLFSSKAEKRIKELGGEILQ